MSTQDWTVLAVTGAKEWKGQHGRMTDYYIDVEGYERNLVLTQKEETPEPNPGDTIYGHVEVLERRKRDGEPFTVHKLKKDRREEGGWEQQAATARANSPTEQKLAIRVGGEEVSYTGRPSSITYTNGDNRSARIERQHSQEMALRYAALVGTFENLRERDLSRDPRTCPPDLLRDLINWFCADLNKHASSHGSQQNTSSSKPVTTPASTGTGGGVEPLPSRTSDDEAKKLAARAAALPEDRVALELVSAGARDISDISKAIRSLSPAQASQFAASLDNIVEEQRHGGGVMQGVGGVDDDIPFAPM